jgi:hypothetical protein
MNHEVQVFEIAPDAKPADRPRAVPGFAVAGDTLEDARRAALERLRSDGRAVRSLSFVADGGLAAVVFPPSPPPAPARAPRARRARGGR